MAIAHRLPRAELAAHRFGQVNFARTVDFAADHCDFVGQRHGIGVEQAQLAARAIGACGHQPRQFLRPRATLGPMVAEHRLRAIFGCQRDYLCALGLGVSMKMVDCHHR